LAIKDAACERGLLRFISKATLAPDVQMKIGASARKDGSPFLLQREGCVRAGKATSQTGQNRPHRFKKAEIPARGGRFPRP